MVDCHKSAERSPPVRRIPDDVEPDLASDGYENEKMYGDSNFNDDDSAVAVAFVYFVREVS